MLTIFSAPKSFTDPHISTIQRNAIQSWLKLGIDTQVLLIGEEPGMDEIAREYRIRLLPDVQRNESGTPLVSSIFDLARNNSESPILVYVNADILLLSDLVEAARQMMQLKLGHRPLSSKFLVIGQRWDLDVRQYPIDFSEDWEARLRATLKSHGRLHLPAGSDYFMFPRYIFTAIPDFAIGRAGWDNWMIYFARQHGWMVVDATPSITVVHQDHDYRHLPGGRPHYELPESRQNEALAGGSASLYMVLDSDWQLREGKLHKPALSLVWLLRRGELLLTPPDGKRQGWRWSLARQFRRARRRLTGSLV